MTSIQIRPATAADQATITSIVRAARINPFQLHWSKFLVAEKEAVIIGVGQIKLHPDGSRELASLAVVPEWQRQGVGSMLINALIGNMTGALYLFCISELEGYYKRFGFHRLERGDLPHDLARQHRIGNLFARIGSQLSGNTYHVIAMRKDV